MGCLLAACGGGGGGGGTPITPSGTVTTLAGAPFNTGSEDGTGAAASFNGPRAVAVDSSGNVYVAETFASTIRKITPAGVVTTLAGLAGNQGSDNGPGADARFFDPMGIAVDARGNVYVADTLNHVIRKITIVDGVATVTTLAGTVGDRGYRDSADGAPLFWGPEEIAVDSSGNLYVVEAANSVVRKITIVDGVATAVTTLAGKAGEPGSTNGTGADARFGGLSGIAVDSSGNVYVSESEGTIRKITIAGDVVTVATLAGTPVPPGESGDFVDGPGDTAKFNYPQGVAVDASGNVFVADFDNQAIRKITPAGEVKIFAGGPTSTSGADGVGTAASTPYPSGITVGSDGYIYFVGEDNRVRKISP